MHVKRGIAVSPGVVSGPALVLGAESFRIPRRFVRVDAVETELARFHAALEAVCDEIRTNERLAASQLGDQYGAIFAAHLQLVQDAKLVGEIEKLIREKCHSPEFACSRVLRRYAKLFQNLGNRYLAERAADIYDLEKRLLKNLLGERREELANLTEPVVVLAHDLTPSETAGLNRDYVLGFATEVGGHTSHTAILAGALAIPAVVGVGNFLSDAAGGETVIIDGNHGEVIIDPDQDTESRYQASVAHLRTVAERLKSLRQLRSETRDGVRIQLRGNIEFPEEVEICQEQGADGIGLYRTEFLYLEKNVRPTEEDHYAAYCKVIEATGEHPVVIRTLDLGADKVPGAMHIPTGLNPVLGLRSIRVCLKHLDLFRTQLRAILRAAVRGDVRIMFPLISTLLEYRQARMILADVMEDLEEQNIEFRRDVPVGIMVEVPAAVMMIEEFAREVDFFSIGTNDLIQYTLAADRANPTVADLYKPSDPAIIRMLARVIDAAAARDLDVTVCGQMSSDPIYIPLLLGMGLRQLSVTPHAIPELKDVIRNITIEQAEQIACHARKMDMSRDIENYLKDELQKLCPDLAH